MDFHPELEQEDGLVQLPYRTDHVLSLGQNPATAAMSSSCAAAHNHHICNCVRFCEINYSGTNLILF